MSGTPLTDAINALTTYANEITGQSDTTLSDAVGSLVDGYGGGGGGSCASGTLTVSSETKTGSIDTELTAVNFFYMVLRNIESTTPTAWKSVSVIHDFNEQFTFIAIKYGSSSNRNHSGTFTFSNGIISFESLQYNLNTGTYDWYAM